MMLRALDRLTTQQSPVAEAVEAALDTAPPDTPFSRGKFTLLAAKDFHLLPPASWLIEDVLPSSGLAAVYGVSGGGKSFICLDMAARIAKGMEWFGHKTIMGRVVYVVQEGRHGVRWRTEAYAKQSGLEYPNEVKFVFEQFALNKPEDIQGLTKVIEDFGGADLIIIDTLNRAAPGADENSSADMGRILAGASALHEATGGLVLLVHHPGKDLSRGMRGHSSLIAALDAVLEVEKDNARRWWRMAKSKDGEEGITHVFALVPVELETAEPGKTRKSCVVEHLPDEVVQTSQKQPRGDNQRVLLKGVEELLAEDDIAYNEDGTPCASGVPFNDAVYRLKELLEDVEPKRRRERATTALEGLVKSGHLTLTDGVLSLPSQAPSPAITSNETADEDRNDDEDISECTVRGEREGEAPGSPLEQGSQEVVRGGHGLSGAVPEVDAGAPEAADDGEGQEGPVESVER